MPPEEGADKDVVKVTAHLAPGGCDPWLGWHRQGDEARFLQLPWGWKQCWVR